MWHFQPTALPHSYVISMPTFTDDRGSFSKSFHHTVFQEHGIDFQLKESYFSISGKDVIRGMHFQLPPHHHSKVVFCPLGAILDVIVDLRVGSPTYKQWVAQILSDENHKAFYIPPGFAHGFKSLTADAVTYYLVSSEYSKEHDTGVRYDSIGFDWNVAQPIISERDMSFSTIEQFNSPFTL
jgi:dTDP-4-dehydrorhamnose 3,5-epimerase